MAQYSQTFRWSGRIELLEDRLVMSASPLSGLGAGAMEYPAESPVDFFAQVAAGSQRSGISVGALEDAHNQTGLSDVRTDYGFVGTGQTVAVIDTGIAYDHFALGGGFGSNYRVVGGWDFTGENDGDPYDDGPAGSQGTHVAGIVGGDAGNDTGVAPGVDLVGLRVFDDSGTGLLEWVENALDWVHTNKNSFANPITTVNLSLGVSDWNADTIPAWANLEDEFAQLKADGIFIAVSAGNGYTTFDAPGLSYPATSPYVIPVMSTDDSGSLSFYSQRHSRAIAAPGRSITSTVPDYAGNNNGIADDYGEMSGTDMAAPYVAGASVLVREAMEFVGNTNITQDTIYDHMVATADTFFDSATDAWYDRLNLEAAIDALMPADDYGSTLETAYDLGTISNPMAISGAITTLNDVDYFTFTAGETGTVTFTASNRTHALEAAWEVFGGNGTSTGANNEIFTVDVVEGQSYTVGLSSSDGLGYYDLDITAEPAFSYSDWGAVSFSELESLVVADDSWYRVEATRNGFLTVECLFDSAGSQIHLELYNASLDLLDTGFANGGESRVDSYASVGDEFFVRMVGSNNDVDFRLTNLVGLSGTTIDVVGTVGDDSFSFTAGNLHQLSVNGVVYGFSAIAVSDFHFAGGAGYDSIVLTGTTSDETATLRVADTTLEGIGFTASVIDVEDVSVFGGGGQDGADLYDTSSDDALTTTSTSAELTGTSFTSRVHDFYRVYAYATGGGEDTAELHGAVNDETLTAGPNWAWFSSDSFVHYAKGFEWLEVYAVEGGNDRAFLHGSSLDDTLTAGPNWAWYSGPGFVNYANGFDRVNSYAVAGGTDRAFLHDSPGDDVLTTNPSGAWFSGNGFVNYASDFNRINAYATDGGLDRAYLYDSAGDDILTTTPDGAWFTSAGYVSYASGFEQVHAFATAGGYDSAYLYDSIGNDNYYSTATRVVLSGSNFYSAANEFEQVRAYSSAGTDRVDFLDVVEGEKVQGVDDLAQVVRLNSMQKVFGFGVVTAHIETEDSLEIDLAAIDYTFTQIGI